MKLDLHGRVLRVPVSIARNGCCEMVRGPSTRRPPSPRVRGEGRDEHLCWESSMFWRLMLPSSVFVDQGISEDDELSGDRDEGNLCGFSALCQAEIEGFHIGIDASSRHGSEVEDPAHTRPTAP